MTERKVHFRNPPNKHHDDPVPACRDDIKSLGRHLTNDRREVTCKRCISTELDRYGEWHYKGPKWLAR